MRNRFMTWLYIGSASDWAVVLFVLSAFISCGKSLFELYKAVGSYPLSLTMTFLNVAIILLFIVSMGLAFMIDSVRETE